MSPLTGRPDFARPVRRGDVSGYAAYERPGVVCVPPTGLRPDAVDPLRLDLWQQPRGDEVESWGLLTAAYALDVPSGPGLRPAPLSDGRLRLTAPAELGLPADLLAPADFDAAVGRSLPVVVRLDDVGAELLAGCVTAGLAALGAEATVAAWGVATRCPGVLTVDVDALPPDLGDPREVLALPGVTVSGGPDDAQLCAAAVAERLAAAWSDGPGLETGARRPPPPAAGARLTFDLSAVASGRRTLRLTADPITTVDPPDVVRRHTAPALTDGRERITVYTTLPASPAGLALATVRLTAPPVPPGRPFPARADGVLTPPDPLELVLALRTGEPLVYELVGSAVVDTDAGPRVLTGPGRRIDGDATPVVTPADLGLRLLPVDATEALLARAAVEVGVRADLDGDDYAATVSLAPGRGRDWLVVPRAATGLRVTASATTTRAGTQSRVEIELPDAPVWLDLLSFPDSTDPDSTDPDATQPDPTQPDPPPEPVVVEAGGLRVVGLPGAADWRFVPLIAEPVRDPAGSAQVSVIEAGDGGFLMVTTALAVSDAAQDAAALACVAAGAAPGVRLSPAPVEVPAVILLVRRDAALTPLATATASGTATQDAAFAVTLDGPDLGVVRRALDGEAGLLVARYVLSVSATGPAASLLAGPTGELVVESDASTWSH